MFNGKNICFTRNLTGGLKGKVPQCSREIWKNVFSGTHLAKPYVFAATQCSALSSTVVANVVHLHRGQEGEPETEDP